MDATAYWTTGPRRGELRREPIPAPGPDEVLVRALASGISRGTELLVHRHEVPDHVRASMRAPFQAGELPGPVKYGYLSVGVVEAGPSALLGRRVFCLHPHQDRYVVPAASVIAVPDDVPTERAVLAGTVETAVNALWDAAPRLGDRIAVVGGGMVGLSVAALLSRFPLSRLELIEIDAARAQLDGALDLRVVSPDAASGDCDLVFHTSATEEGLATALRLLGTEGEVIELSWYGSDVPRVPLGGEFHTRRLAIRASCVNRLSPSRSARRTPADRLALALTMLGDPVFDVLLGEPVPFADLPKLMTDLDAGRVAAPCQVVVYPEPEEGPCSN
jgi:threonine dehydrogenase-like Zn-dependent dehydrogenase